MRVLAIEVGDRRLAIVGGRCHGVEVLEECCQTGSWLCSSLETGDLYFVHAPDLGQSLPRPDDFRNAIAAADHVTLCLHERLGE